MPTVRRHLCAVVACRPLSVSSASNPSCWKCANPSRKRCVRITTPILSWLFGQTCALACAVLQVSTLSTDSQEAYRALNRRIAELEAKANKSQPPAATGKPASPAPASAAAPAPAAAAAAPAAAAKAPAASPAPAAPAPAAAAAPAADKAKSK